jgi:hypothetical protein
MVWVAVSVAAWTLTIDVSRSLPGFMLLCLCYLLRFVGPPATIGALFDETLAGLLIGAAFVTLFLALLGWHTFEMGLAPGG